MIRRFAYLPDLLQAHLGRDGFGFREIILGDIEIPK